MNSKYIFAATAAATLVLQTGRSEDRKTHASEAESVQLQEVVVTAQKREQRLSKAPLAVAALSQQQLEAAGVHGIQDLTSVTPNVDIATSPIFPDSVFVTIRGIGSVSVATGGEPAVASYVDGVYVARPEAFGALYDVSRVEILRGPQGTLYGRNATAGSINIINASPAQNFDASTSVSYGNYNDFQFNGMLNIPVTNTLALRFAAYEHTNDGYFDTKGTTERNYDLTDEHGERLTALWRPTDNFKWQLSIEDLLTSGTPNLGIDTAPNGTPIDGYPIFNRPVQSNPEPYQSLHDFSIRSRMDWQLNDAVSADYVGGYQSAHWDYDTLFQTAIGEVPLGASYGGERNINNYQEVDLNLNSGRWRDILGGTYSYSNSSTLFNNPLDTIDLNNVVIESGVLTKSWGLFDQATFSVWDNLRLTAGVRYSHDLKIEPFQNLGCPLDVFYTGGAVPSVCTSSVTYFSGHPADWSKINWKGALEYDLSAATMSYLSVSTGYRAGGYNQEFSPNPTIAKFNPETVTNYEAGIKTHFFEDRLSVNLDAFLENYKDIQVTQAVGFFQVTENAAAARVYGTELEWRARLSGADYLDGFVNYLHATYTDYKNAIDGEAGAIVPSLDGNQLIQAPTFSAHIQYSHDFLVANGAVVTPAAAVYYQSHSYLREFNFPIDGVPAYTKTNLQLRYRSATGQWSVEAYVSNLEDKLIRIGSQPILGRYSSFYGPPRTYGVRASYHFGQ